MSHRFGAGRDEGSYAATSAGASRGKNRDTGSFIASARVSTSVAENGTRPAYRSTTLDREIPRVFAIRSCVKRFSAAMPRTLAAIRSVVFVMPDSVNGIPATCNHRTGVLCEFRTT